MLRKAADLSLKITKDEKLDACLEQHCQQQYNNCMSQVTFQLDGNLRPEFNQAYHAKCHKDMNVQSPFEWRQGLEA